MQQPPVGKGLRTPQSCTELQTANASDNNLLQSAYFDFARGRAPHARRDWQWGLESGCPLLHAKSAACIRAHPHCLRGPQLNASWTGLCRTCIRRRGDLDHIVYMDARAAGNTKMHSYIEIRMTLSSPDLIRGYMVVAYGPFWKRLRQT